MIVCALLFISMLSVSKLSGQVIDDSFTYFKADAVNGPNGTYLWQLIPDISIPGAAKGSPLRIVLKKAGKEVYSHQCPLAGQSGTQTQACYARNGSISETGVFDVELFLNNSGAGERLIRKCKIDVRQTSKQGGRRPEFYIQRHADAAVGYLNKNLQNVLLLNTVFSPIEDLGKTWGYTPNLKCSVNGTPVKIGDSRISFRQASNRVISGFSESFGANRVLQRDYIRFDQMAIQLPLTLGPQSQSANWYDVTKSSGKWSCDIVGEKSNGVFRTIRFEVANGQIVPHPEQRSGNVNLDKDKWMIDMEIPTGGSEIDARLMPSPTAGLFYGIPWSTAEGKAMAGRLPKKGEPFVVSK